MKKIFKLAQRLKKSDMYSPYGEEPQEEEEEEYIPDMPSPGEEMGRHPELSPQGPRKLDPRKELDIPGYWLQELDIKIKMSDMLLIHKALNKYLEGAEESEAKEIENLIKALKQSAKRTE